MEQLVERIHTAAKKSDYREIERIIHQLITVGACDPAQAVKILSRE